MSRTHLKGPLAALDDGVQCTAAHPSSEFRPPVVTGVSKGGLSVGIIGLLVVIILVILLLRLL